MRIGIDARPLTYKPGGIPRGLRRIFEALEKIDGSSEYFLYSHRDFDLPFKNPRWQKRLDLRFSWMPGTLWLQARAGRTIRQSRLDLFLGTAQFLPLGLPKSIRKLLIVHDLTWKLFPETATFYDRMIQGLFSKSSIEAADRIVVYSHSTRRDLERIMGVPQERIAVCPNGVSPDFHTHDNKNAAMYIAQKYETSPNYICAVGTLEPRKNLVTLIEAFALLKKRGSCPSQLVIAGPRGWGNLQLQKKAEASELTGRDLKFLGFVPDPDLPLLYSGASAFVFPSLYEGFGLPLLEAMACGTPVACSNRSSLPEIGGDAALYFNPESAEEMASAVNKILNDSALGENLIRLGLERTKQFSWESCAKLFLSAFDEVTGKKTSPNR